MLLTSTNSKQQINTQKVPLAKALLSKRNSSQQGFTLLESLIAIMVITVVIAALTPPIFLSVATRVQNRKAEQAMQLAQGEIDRVRRLVERGDYTIFDPDPNQRPLTLPPVAASGMTCLNNVSAPASAEEILNLNNDNIHKFRVQSFRTDGILDPNTGKPVAFNLGVRVYAWFPDGPTLETQPASLKFTSAVGSQRTRPLSVLYTKVVRSDTPNSLNYYSNAVGTSCP